MLTAKGLEPSSGADYVTLRLFPFGLFAQDIALVAVYLLDPVDSRRGLLRCNGMAGPGFLAQPVKNFA